MRIAFEVGLNVEGDRGFETYIRGLLGAMARLDASNEYELFSYFFRDYEKKTSRIWIPKQDNFHAALRRWPERLVNALEWGGGLPVIDQLFVRPMGIDLYHSHGALPRISKARSVVTAFDFIPEVLREQDLAAGRPSTPFSPSYVKARRNLLKADHIVTPSETAAHDAVRFYGVAPERVTVTSAGVDHDLFKPADLDESRRNVRSKHGLQDYILLIGPFERRRNAERVLEAFSRLKRAGAAGSCRAVLVGSKNDYYGILERKARELGIEGEVSALGYVDRLDLPDLYRAARAFVHPSLWDGLSMSILEAMACAAVVVTSNVSGQKEAGLGGALLVDPGDTESIAAAIRDALGQKNLAAELRRKAAEKALRFTWERSARLTLKVYDKLLRRA